MFSNKELSDNCGKGIFPSFLTIENSANVDPLDVNTCESPDVSSEGTCKTVQLRKVGLFLADHVFSGLIIGPLTVFYWWGAWNLLGRYIYPNDPHINAIICMVIGNCGLFFLALSQEMWKRLLPVNDNWLAWLVGFHGYVFVCGLFNVCHWRGMWIIMDHYTGTGVLNFCITYIIGQGSLMFFKSSKSAQAPPMVVVSDRTSSLFSYQTRFKTEPGLTLNFIYDSMFTVVIINQLVIFYWRGVWGILDELFLKDQKKLSTWIGFAVAYSLMVMLCFLQPAFNHLYNEIARKRRSTTNRKSSAVLKHFIMNVLKLKRAYRCRSEHEGDVGSSTPRDDAREGNMTTSNDDNVSSVIRWFLDVVIYFISNIVNVFVWRSTWNLCDEHLLPWNEDAGHAAGVCIGLGMLMILTCSPSVTIRGCDIDGDESTPSDLVFYSPNFYFRNFFKI